VNSHKEPIALTTGRHKLGVEVLLFPPGVLARFAEASKAILAMELDTGELAQKGGAALTGLMLDLGYA
jgi:hypothetical protein